MKKLLVAIADIFLKLMYAEITKSCFNGNLS